MNAAIARRLRALEKQATESDRPAVAFVLWERTRDLVEAAYRRALEAGAIRKDDPAILGVMPLPAPLPESRWTDGADLTDGELAQIAHHPGITGLQSAVGMNLSDVELASAVIAGTARYAT